MCGIAAILLNPQSRTAAEWQAIREIFTRNLLFNEERGRAATGLAVMHCDGSTDLYKAPLPASQFVETPRYLSFLDQVNDQTTLILGHTRLPTKGDPTNEQNNHPIHTGPVFGVHNGHIKNDNQLFDQLGYHRQAEVDSEIIFQMLAAFSPQPPPDVYLAQISHQITLLQGQFTFIAYDQRSPYGLLVLKHNNPLCIHFHEPWNALIFSSRYIFLRKAFGFSLITETLAHDQLMLFDARAISRERTQPPYALSLTFDDGDSPNGSRNSPGG